MPEALPMAGGFGAGAVTGTITGFAVKKLVKLVLKVITVLLGIQMAVFAAFEHYGLITVDWDGMNRALVDVMGFGAQTGDAAASVTPTIMDTFLSVLPVGGGFALGAAVGFQKG